MSKVFLNHAYKAHILKNFSCGNCLSYYKKLHTMRNNYPLYFKGLYKFEDFSLDNVRDPWRNPKLG